MIGTIFVIDLLNTYNYETDSICYNGIDADARHDFGTAA